MTKLNLKAEKRQVTGRKVKKLRKQEILPGNVYGKNVKSLSVQVPLSDFQKVFKEAGETNLIDLKVDSSVKPVLIHNVQTHPVTDMLLHVDFLQVDLKQKITAQIPIELIGESPAEKQGLGTVVKYIDEVEVEALPGDLPDKFEIDLAKLVEVDQAVSLKDLVYDKTKIELKGDSEQVLVKVEPPKAVEEEVPAPSVETVAAEGEGVEKKEGSAEETETPQKDVGK